MHSRVFSVSLSVGLLAAASAWADPAPEAAPPTPNENPTAAPPTGQPPATVDTTAARERPASGEEERTANNVLYLEGLGPGLFYSINYERCFGDFSGRIGFGYVGLKASATAGSTGSSASASFLVVPIMVNYLGIGSKRNMLELGAGVSVIHMGAGASTFTSDSSSSGSASSTIVLGAVAAGYRFQPVDGGFVFRVGVAPLIGGNSLPVLPWPYLALGGTFGP